MNIHFYATADWQQVLMFDTKINGFVILIWSNALLWGCGNCKLSTSTNLHLTIQHLNWFTFCSKYCVSVILNCKCNCDLSFCLLRPCLLHVTLSRFLTAFALTDIGINYLHIHILYIFRQIDDKNKMHLPKMARAHIY